MSTVAEAHVSVQEHDEQPTMRLRECAGAIRKVTGVYVQVFLDDSECVYWCEVSKVSARQLLRAAREQGMDCIAAQIRGNKLYIEELEESDDPESEEEDSEDDELEEDDDVEELEDEEES